MALVKEELELSVDSVVVAMSTPEDGTGRTMVGVRLQTADGLKVVHIMPNWDAVDQLIAGLLRVGKEVFGARNGTAH